MGDIADAMLDGTLCAGCGEYLEMEPMGFPVYCSSCEPDDEPRKAKGSIGKATRQHLIAIGEKQTERLRRILSRTDAVTGGEYPGCLLEEAPAKFRALINLGYAALWEPHNPIHKARVVITELGREFLKGKG